MAAIEKQAGRVLSPQKRERAKADGARD